MDVFDLAWIRAIWCGCFWFGMDVDDSGVDVADLGVDYHSFGVGL